MLQELERGGRNCFHMQFRVKGQEPGEEGEEKRGKRRKEEEETCGSKHLGRRSERPLLRKPLVRIIMV